MVVASAQGDAVTCRLILFGLALFASALDGSVQPNHQVLVAVGAPGEEQYAPGFAQAAEAWRKAAESAGAAITVIGTEASPAAPDREQIRRWLAGLHPAEEAPVWLVFIGHGTFDQRQARFNLRGPDLAAEELAEWIASLQRQLVIIHGGSASAPWIPVLSAPGRIIITATRSGDEMNYARFGEKLAQAIGSAQADVSGDGETSLLEAFVVASREAQAFYAEANRLPSEHALLDDNGDGVGVSADWYQGVRLIKEAEGADPDGREAHRLALATSPLERALSPEQRQLRDDYERELEALRARKENFSSAEYFDHLEAILSKLSDIYLSVPADDLREP